MLGFAKDLALPASSPPSPNSLPSFWEVSVILPLLSSLTLGWQVGEGKWLPAAELPVLLPAAAATTEPGHVTAQQRKTQADPSSSGGGGAGGHGGVSFSIPVDERRLGLNLIYHFAASAKTQKGEPGLPPSRHSAPRPPGPSLPCSWGASSRLMAFQKVGASSDGLGGLHRARSRTKEGCWPRKMEVS